MFVKKLVLKWKAKEDGSLTVSGDIDLANTGEDDMMTTARYAILLDGKDLAADRDEDVDTEEGKTRYRKIKLKLKGSTPESLKGATLKIVLAVVKD